MADFGSMRGSIASCSSDAATLTTVASSWCAVPASARIRVLRLVRPHMRRMLVAPADMATPSYGFSVRGGKEFGSAFFISHVVRASEADQKGLRVGDQIMRINGFRIDDAVHKEVTQYVNSQDRITLQVRGVGMLPVKEQEADRLTWRVVSGRPGSVSGRQTPSSESSYACPTAAIERDKATRRRCQEVHVVLPVAPRTKLGLGICKGPEWKPGIFVQFTKERGVAREAGLRQGDQILSANSVDFADVLFSEAVAVMKGASLLEMVILTAAGCDLFPGESSGYNSSASSVTGDQSPCWADAKSKRLTAVREETGTAAATAAPAWTFAGEEAAQASASGYAAGQAVTTVNKTIIQLSENGSSINNTYVANEHVTRTAPLAHVTTASGEVAPPLPPPPPRIATLPGPAEGLIEAGPSIRSGVDSHGRSGGGRSAAPILAGEAQSAAGANGGDSLCSAITQELRKRREQQQRTATAAAVGTTVSSAAINCASSPRRSSSNRQQCHPDAAAAAQCPAGPPSRGEGGAHQHNALMHEFMSFHQQMFKNGFHETEQERQEALSRTTMMANDADHRNSPAGRPIDRLSQQRNAAQPPQGVAPSKLSAGDAIMPPPPPQFANATPRASLSAHQTQRRRQQHDNMVTRRVEDPAGGTRLSAGGITIGQYESRPTRKEPSKLDLSAARALDSNGGGTHAAGRSLQAELQQTLSRAQLTKTAALQHKQDCPLLRGSQHESVGGAANGGSKRAGGASGILKNSNHSAIDQYGGGQRSHAGFYATKNAEKSITFGN